MQDVGINEAKNKAMYEEFRRIALNEKPDGCANLKLVKMVKEATMILPATDNMALTKMFVSSTINDCEQGDVGELFEMSNIIYRQPCEDERREMGVSLLEYIPHWD